MFDDSDPRLTGDYLRWLPGESGRGDVILTGVVHDHPASEFRVRSVVEAVDPDVLALELPPMAVPLFERWADDERTPPASGGEMSAAIRAATTDAVVGIDGPTPAFLVRLAGNLYREDVSLSTVRRLLGGVVSVTKHAIACRIAATFGAPTAAGPSADSPVAHDSDWTDDPRQQAADERTQIRRAESVLNAFGGLGAVHLRDVTREAHMGDRISTLRRTGTVVAVVGVGHLDALTDLLE